MELERVLISHGDRIRAANSTAAFKVRTRRVWLKGTRVLQGKMSQFNGYQNLMGLEATDMTECPLALRTRVRPLSMFPFMFCQRAGVKEGLLTLRT